MTFIGTRAAVDVPKSWVEAVAARSDSVSRDTHLASFELRKAAPEIQLPALPLSSTLAQEELMGD